MPVIRGLIREFATLSLLNYVCDAVFVGKRCISAGRCTGE